jgi:hypothetical protein
MRKLWSFEVFKKHGKLAKGGATWHHWKGDMWHIHMLGAACLFFSEFQEEYDGDVSSMLKCCV